jgi:microcystin degradation protein MlrC
VRAARARRDDIEPVPLLSAWAVSGGPLSRACFDALEAKLVDGLRRAGRLDALYLCLHGAMGVTGIDDPETQLVRTARDVLGGAPVVVSHDLHANVTRARVDAADAIVAYQTNPHRDHVRTGRRAGAIAIGMALGELRPVMAWRSLPLLLGGGSTIDFLAPMRHVFRRMRAAERAGDALAASTFMVHPWSAEPRRGWSTLVVADQLDEADRLADELAQLCWERRLEQPPQFANVRDAIAEARAARWRRRLGCVVFVDTSDVVTAGAPGDSTRLLRSLIEDASDLRVYTALRDTATVAALWSRLGDRVSLAIGGSSGLSSPLPVTGVVSSRHTRPGFGRSVVLVVEQVSIVITEGPALAIRPAFYRDVGLEPWRADIVTVKSFFPPLVYFAAVNRKTIFVRTSGPTDLDAAFTLPSDGAMYPRDRIDDWRPRDRQRRGLAT